MGTEDATLDLAGIVAEKSSELLVHTVVVKRVGGEGKGEPSPVWDVLHRVLVTLVIGWEVKVVDGDNKPFVVICNREGKPRYMVFAGAWLDCFKSVIYWWKTAKDHTTLANYLATASDPEPIVQLLINDTVKQWPLSAAAKLVQAQVGLGIRFNQADCTVTIPRSSNKLSREIVIRAGEHCNFLWAVHLWWKDHLTTPPVSSSSEATAPTSP